MSGQWEVVGKKRDRESKLPVPKGNQNKIKESKTTKNVLNGVKIEEVLPKSQLQNLYNKNKENKKANIEKVKVLEPTKKAVKKEKPQETPAPKPKPPKSIEGALNLINVEDFRSTFENSKAHFPDTPIVWLKELVQFLSQKVPLEVQDPFFSNKPDGYPLYVVPSGIKTVIEKSVKESGKNNTQLFFDICLTSMATDMGKGLPAMGNRFFLQHIARNEPKLVTENLNKYVSLRNSYQNRANIGLAILWAVGQVGYSDFNSGLTVFQELFLPLLDHKNYSGSIAGYLLTLLDTSPDISLTKEQYLLILDAIYLNKKNVPADLKKALQAKASELKPSLFKNPKEKYHAYIEPLLRKMSSNPEKSYVDCLCSVLVEVFEKDASTLANWSKVYQKNVAVSAILLEYIVDNWKSVSKTIGWNELKQLLDGFSAVNKELSSKKRVEDGVRESMAAIRKIEEKMVAKKSSGFPYRTLSFLLTLGIVGLIYYDVKSHNGWKDSRTASIAKEYRICEYSRLALDRAKGGLSWLDSRIDENFPGYREALIEVTEPYVQLCSDLALILRNTACSIKEVIVEKYPVAVKSIEAYIPGLLEQSQRVVSNAYSTSVLYFSRSVDYLKHEVFVGQLSPENMQKVVIEAFNTTQQKAAEYYHWIYEKVQMTIK